MTNANQTAEANRGTQAGERPSRVALLALLLGLALPTSALEISMETREGGSEAGREVSKMIIDGRRLRLQTPDDKGYMIFLGADQTMYAVDPSSKSYVRFDEALAKQVGATLSQARKQMEEQLKNVPPEQRAMVERMMAGRMPIADTPKKRSPLAVRATSETKTVDGISCQVSHVLRDGKVEGHLCIASWSDSGVDQSDLRVFRDMAAFYHEILNAMGTNAPDLGGHPFEVFDQLDGFPILASEIEDGRTVRETRMRPVDTGKPDDSVFAPPPDYTLRDPMQMSGMR